MPSDDETFMRIALGCAARGRGQVEPNPMVGAVLVRQGAEIARGWHRRFGQAHAEVAALAAARSSGALVCGATMYVTLEPCTHHGKTPPCVDALIEAGLARVVVAMEDPDQRVRGQGVAKLRAAGITVDEGVCGAEARELLGAYLKLRTAGRPWVICKWAQTADGYLAMPPGQGRWISGDSSRRRVHELRGRCDGVLVGIGTALADDPLLTNRSAGGRQPGRVVLDARLRLALESQLARTAEVSPVVVATTAEAIDRHRDRAEALRRAGLELLALPAAPEGVDLDALLDELGRRQWTNLLVEGGARVLRSFILGGHADELLVYVAPKRIPDAPPSLPRFDIEDLREELSKLSLGEAQEERFGRDVLYRYLLTRGS